MNRQALRALSLCALLLSAALAGCATTLEQPGDASRGGAATPAGSAPTPAATRPASPAPAPPASTAPASTTPGHALATSTFTAASATLSGVSVPLNATGLALRLAPNLTSLGDHRALVLYDARLPTGETGVLFALVADGPVLLQGRLSGAASTVRLTSTQAGLLVAEDPDVFAKPMLQGALHDAVSASNFSSDLFFAKLLKLSAEGPLAVKADRLVLVTAEGARELGRNVSLASAGRMSATAAVEEVRAPSALAVEVSDKRGQLAIQGAQGEARFARRASLQVHGDAVLTLARGSTVSLKPTSSGAQVVAQGRAFQAYAGGAALLPSTMRLELDQTTFSLARDQGASTAFRLVATDPDADPVITAIRVEGGPPRAIVLPGWVPITQQILDSVEGDPFGTLAVAPALPLFAIADVLFGFLDALFGPAKITQSIEAGTTFTSALTIVGDDAPSTTTLVIEGNFPTQRVGVRVE